jgi:serine/threonine protein kinase
MTTTSHTAQSLSDIAQIWLLSGQHASIERIDLRPSENSLLKGNPLVIARGQARAYFLHDPTGKVWILKKFLPGRKPDANYLNAIQALIPQEPGFECGYQRRVIYGLTTSPGAFAAPDFAVWIEGTILMPLIGGTDWAYIADQVRAGTIQLTFEQRLSLCRSLSTKIEILERNGLAHRDLSSTNIFVDTKKWEVHLIDWDSLYHSSLSIPVNTTFGTSGYIAPFVRVNGVEDSKVTWRDCADRFSLAILNSEFLCIDQSSPITGDGGMVEQQEIHQHAGPGLDQILIELEKRSTNAAHLLRMALRANNFSSCPKPSDWIALTPTTVAPSLASLYDPQPDFRRFIQELQKQPRQQPAPPAPALKEIELPDLTPAAHITNRGPAASAPDLSAVESLEWNRLPLTAKGPPKKTS